MDNKTTILKGVCEMGKYIGIDLGTTFSCMAYINEEGQPVVIPNGEGKNTTPSTVLFDGTSTIVGEEAKNQSIIDPQNFEQFVKRHMGERDYLFSTEDGEKYSPEAISAIILAKMKADAEQHLGEPIEGAVITVPAYFNEAQRKSTMDAGKIAGLNVLAIINEPTAAALAFGIAKGTEKEQTIMVYDLGGGTFDVTVLKFDAENITVLGTAGDRKLGGYDFDERIINAVIEEAAERGLDIKNDLVARQDLQLKAEEAKKTLSVREKANIVLNIGGRPFKYSLTREEFVDLVEPLLFKTVGSMETACDEAEIEYSDLDKILLVGGSTRMPIVREGRERVMKKIKRIFIMLLCASMLWGCGKSESTTETVSESAPKDLRELNEECITVETGETEMDTETEGTVQLSVEFPDYKSLYLEANESEDPEEFVQEALQQKKFKTCKTEITARVTVENGETVIYKEEAINQLLEKEFTDAINALAEE